MKPVTFTFWDIATFIRSVSHTFLNAVRCDIDRFVCVRTPLTIALSEAGIDLCGVGC